MAQVELKNMYRNMGANKDIEKSLKNTATSGKLIKTVHASFVYVSRLIFIFKELTQFIDYIHF
jgi:hypothetical protein